MILPSIEIPFFHLHFSHQLSSALFDILSYLSPSALIFLLLFSIPLILLFFLHLSSSSQSHSSLSPYYYSPSHYYYSPSHYYSGFEHVSRYPRVFQLMVEQIATFPKKSCFPSPLSPSSLSPLFLAPLSLVPSSLFLLLLFPYFWILKN